MSLAIAEIEAEQGVKDCLGQVITPDSYICLNVTDNGCGMDEETKQRIFEPFYTTKSTGRGLGMSALLRIINAHNGALQLTSQQGFGTTFKVYLPFQSSEPVRNLLPHVSVMPIIVSSGFGDAEVTSLIHENIYFARSKIEHLVGWEE